MKNLEDFVAINFSEYFKSAREKFYSKLSEEQNLRKVAKSLYIFLTTSDEVEKYVCIHRYNVEILNFFDPQLQLINTKPMIKNKLKELLSELKKLKIQKTLVLHYKKKSARKIFHSCTKLIASDSDIDEAFKSMHQRIMTKNYACEDSIVLDVIIKHSNKIFQCFSLGRINSIKNGDNR